MKRKSITHSGASPRKSDCPREDKPVRGNSPDWYTRESIPYKGENFNALTSLSPQPGVMFENGVRTNAAVYHATVIHPPVDRMDSFFKKAADFYAEIRERNSGAANYNVEYLAAYMYDVGVLHALAHAISRAIRSVRSVMPSSADSPYILSALAGVRNYEFTASKLAEYSNWYSLLAKDIENLPLPHVTAFDRSRFLYSSFFADSKGPKPALVSFVPQFVIEMQCQNDGDRVGTINFVTHTVSTVSAPYWIEIALQLMQDILGRLTTNPVITIIRGDVRNAFGTAAYWEGLVALLNQPLNLIPEDPETMAQLENLSLIPRDRDADATVVFSNEGENQYYLSLEIDGINDSPSLSRLWCDNNLVNYHGNYPTDGELLAITRMMYVGKKVNRLTKTDVHILASSGNTVYTSYTLQGVTQDSLITESISTQLLAAQSSAIQSTMKHAFELLTFVASNVAHFPMLIFSDTDNGYMWNTDNYAIMSNINLNNMTVIANRSLWDVHLPRGESGRLQKKA